MTYCANTQCSSYNNCNLYLYCPSFNPTSEKPKSNKYQAQKCVVDGIRFDSKREANRYAELLLLSRIGQITGLQRQVKFELIPAQHEPDKIGKRGGVIKGGVIEKSCDYYADFVYVDSNGQVVIEDTKGVQTKEYVIKRKLMLYKYGIKIREI